MSPEPLRPGQDVKRPTTPVAIVGAPAQGTQSRAQLDQAHSSAVPVLPTLGSADPHHTGDLPTERLPRRIRGSAFRALEAELPSVLRQRLLPRVHVPPSTPWFSPTDTPAADPSFEPETIDEVVTSTFKAAFDATARETKAAHDAASRGALQVAKHLRPKARCLTESQALRKRAQGDRWDLTECELGGKPKRLRASRWPDRPPNTDLRITEVLRAAGADGAESSRFGVVYPDQEMIAWCAHGFESLSLADRSLTVLFAQHMGALRHIEHVDRAIEKGRQKGYLQGPFRKVAPFAPCWCLPYGCVIQKDKPRMTIDPTIQLLEGVVPVNELDEDRVRVVKWLRCSQFCEGIAILQTSGMPVALSSVDGESYYRVLGSQNLDHPLFCIMSHQGTDRDLRVNFGPRHAPSAATRHSHFIVWVCNREMDKFNREHPPRDPKLLVWLEERKQLVPLLDPDERQGPDVRAATLHMMVMYVDDAGLAVIDDVLHKSDGSVWINTEPPRSIPMTRGAALFNIMRKCFNELGHQSSVPKEHPPWTTPGRMVYTGTLIKASARKRETAPEKRAQYAQLCRDLLSQRNRADWSLLNSLWHKLLHAADCMPGGRQHLFALQRLVRATFRMRGRAVRLHDAACDELEWWAKQLLAEQEGVPLTVRQDFESALSDSCLCYYGDASREFTSTGDPDVSGSGFGAWTLRRQGGEKPPLLLFIEGRWLVDECVEMHIGALEFKLQNMALVSLYEAVSADLDAHITHVLEFTDNEASEGATDTGRSGVEMFQRLLAERAAFILEAGIYTHSERITTKANRWADMLSRGLVQDVLAEATALGLESRRVEIRAEVRSTVMARERDEPTSLTPDLPPWATVGRCGDGVLNALPVQRDTPLGNPFLMHGEGQRNAACDAYEQALRDGPAVPLERAAAKHGVQLSSRTPAAEALGRTQAILQLVQRVRNGERFHLQCSCAPKRCHAESLARCVQRLCASPREREAWSRWVSHACHTASEMSPSR